MSEPENAEPLRYTESDIRTLTSTLLARAEFAELAGNSFHGKRNIYHSLGYQKILKPQDYWGRFRRGGIAKRLVEAFPKSTWRGGGTLIEDEDPTTETTFEKAWDELNQRLKIWSTFEKADILAGLGRFSVILLGAPGNLDAPLEKCKPEELKYLNCFSERDVAVEIYNAKPTDERFGMPEFYNLKRINSANRVEVIARRVHYSRVMHMAEGLLDHPLFGTPRLEAIWNYLDDLNKLVGGGAEAFWKRADRGMQLKLDPTIPAPTQTEKDAMKEQIEEFTHDLRRVLTTRGVDIQNLGSDVANFAPSVASLIDLISATTGIPQRILMGSERGELASSTDQSNYDDRVSDRRQEFAGPQVARPFVDRMIELGVLPDAEYEVRWPEIKNLDAKVRAELAYKAAQMNQAQGEIVMTSDEIRDLYLELEPLDQVLVQTQPEPATGEPDPNAPPAPPVAPTAAMERKWAVLTTAEKAKFVAARRKGQPAWKQLHAAADRFRRKTPEARASSF